MFQTKYCCEWIQVCNLLRENIEKRCDVFPLRPKTEEYVKAAYRWAINNRKIVHVMDTEPVYVLAQKDSAGQHIFLVSADSEGSIMVFVSEEAAEAHRDILSDESTEIEVVKILLPSLFHPLARQDIQSVVFYDAQEGGKVCLSKDEILFFRSWATHTSPFPAGLTTVTQSIHQFEH